MLINSLRRLLYSLRFFSLFFFFVFLLVNTVSSSSSRALARRISGGGITAIAPASAARCFPRRDGRTLLEVRPATILALRTDFPFLCFTVFVFLFLVVICIFNTLIGQFPSIRFLSTSGSARANFLILVIYLNSALVTRFNSNGATTPANAPTKPPFINRAFFFLTVPDFLLSVLSEFAYLDNYVSVWCSVVSFLSGRSSSTVTTSSLMRVLRPLLAV